MPFNWGTFEGEGKNENFSKIRIFIVDGFYICSKITSTIVEGENIMKLTEAEWQIMNALWQGYPATARQIADRLPEEVNWAYTTIKTMLTRLAEKKVVRETKKANIGVYEPVLSRSRAQSSALKALVNQAFDGAFGPLMHFLLEDQKLSTKQRRELIKTLREQAGKKKGGKK